MNSAFLDNLTLKTLLAPVTEEVFRARYWERAPLVVHRNDPDYYGDLFTLEDFDRVMANAPAKVVTAEANTGKYSRYKAKTASIPLETILADMREGTTLLLEQLHRSEHKLSLLCRVLEQQLGHRFHTNLYLTPPHGRGLTPHWDDHDTFILQVFGSKHWKTEKRRRKLPRMPEQMPNEGRELAVDANSFTLNRGDMVYIPRGFVHAAECGSESSLHITLGVNVFTWEDLLRAAITAAALKDENLRLGLPLGFMHHGGQRLVSRAITALRDITDEAFLSTVVDQFRDELVTTFPVDVSGQVLDFFHPVPLTAKAVVGPRRGIMYRVHDGDNSVRLNVGDRSIVFPDLFRDALDFALTTPAFAIGELPGEIEDEERIVFIERLMQEGLVVRKQDGETP